MKAGAWLVLGGAVAGFLAVLGLHRPGRIRRADPRPRTGRPARAAAPPAAGPAAGTVTGPVVTVRVRRAGHPVTVSNGQITGVSVPVLKTAEQFSQQLANQAIPVLRHEVLAAHSRRGSRRCPRATYTSEAYAQSVQAALDKAHFR